MNNTNMRPDEGRMFIFGIFRPYTILTDCGVSTIDNQRLNSRVAISAILRRKMADISTQYG